MAGRPSTGIEFNRSALLVLGALGLIVYAVYSFLPSSNSQSDYHPNSHSAWKTREFKTIPSDVISRISKIKVHESEVSYMFSKDVKYKIFYRETKPYDNRENAPQVVLLHGSGDDSSWWQAIGTLQILSAAGYHVFAFDLPGWGKTETTKVEDPAKFLESLFKELKIGRPIVVAASMGGSYGLPYIMGSDPLTCEMRVTGFVPIAIVGTENYKPPQYHRCNVPTMIVYGTKDTRLGLYSVGDLRNMANSDIFPMEKAGHACVREKPDEWHGYIYNFAVMVAPIK